MIGPKTQFVRPQAPILSDSSQNHCSAWGEMQVALRITGRMIYGRCHHISIPIRSHATEFVRSGELIACSKRQTMLCDPHSSPGEALVDDDL